MTPLDSMKYYKSFFRPGMMSMDPTNGYIKAWVGGMNYRHFQYDMVKKVRDKLDQLLNHLYMLQLLIN